MSFGLAWSRELDDSAASLIARADAALYRAKTAGRHRALTEFVENPAATLTRSPDRSRP